jgi:hypothetical protein
MGGLNNSRFNAVLLIVFYIFYLHVVDSAVPPPGGFRGKTVALFSDYFYVSKTLLLFEK